MKLTNSFLFLSILTFSATVSAQILSHGVRGDMYNALINLKQRINLTDDEFNTLLASNQQIEIAATTTVPTAEQLTKFGHVQALSNLCSTRLISHFAQLPKGVPIFPNVLDTQERRRTFMAFTGKVQLRKSELEIQNVMPEQACSQAADLIVK